MLYDGLYKVISIIDVKYCFTFHYDNIIRQTLDILLKVYKMEIRLHSCMIINESEILMSISI